MTDRHRFGRRANELRALADRMEPLAKMPDRVTGVDIQSVVDLAKKAASDLDALTSAQPPGCVCRWYVNDDYRQLDYEEVCVHHGQLRALSNKLKADYAKMEKALKNETRVKIIASALTGAALVRPEDVPSRSTAATRPVNVGTAFYPIQEAPRSMTNSEAAIQIVERAMMIADEAIRRITEVT